MSQIVRIKREKSAAYIEVREHFSTRQFCTPQKNLDNEHNTMLIFPTHKDKLKLLYESNSKN